MLLHRAFFNGPLQVSWLSRSAPDREIPGSTLRGRERMCVWGKGARHGTARHGTARHGLGSVRCGAERGWRACASLAPVGAASIESTIDSCSSVAFVAVSCSRVSGLSPGRAVSQAARAACVRACARGTGRLRRADHGRAACRRAGYAGIAREPAGQGPALRHCHWCVVLSKSRSPSFGYRSPSPTGRLHGAPITKLRTPPRGRPSSSDGTGPGMWRDLRLRPRAPRAAPARRRSQRSAVSGLDSHFHGTRRRSSYGVGGFTA